MIKSLTAEHLSEEKILVFDSKIEADISKLNHLNQEMARSVILEELSGQTADDRLSLNELIEPSTGRYDNSIANFDRKRSQPKSQSFSLANIKSNVQSATKYFVDQQNSPRARPQN